jgi:hypothetical protein
LSELAFNYEPHSDKSTVLTKPVIGFGLISNGVAWLLIALIPSTGSLVAATIIVGSTVSVMNTSTFRRSLAFSLPLGAP